MPGWLWWAPLGVLVAVLAVYGFRLGWIAARITETDVINVYAARYIAEAGPGAEIRDCVAQPGPSPVIWIVVRCGPAGRESARYFEYHVNRLGGLVRFGMAVSGGAASEPRT